MSSSTESLTEANKGTIEVCSSFPSLTSVSEPARVHGTPHKQGRNLSKHHSQLCRQRSTLIPQPLNHRVFDVSIMVKFGKAYGLKKQHNPMVEQNSPFIV
jgi:hypothetical protein